MSYQIAVILNKDGVWFPEGDSITQKQNAIAALVDAEARGRLAHVVYYGTDEVVDVPPEQERMAIAWEALTKAKYLRRSVHLNSDGSEQVLMKSGRTILIRYKPENSSEWVYTTALRDPFRRYPNDREI